MNANGVGRTLLFSLAILASQGLAAAPDSDDRMVQRGRYMIIAGACNDCHTAGYMQTEGNVPEPQWLTGNTVGFQGPWGTSYPVNLRLYVDGISEAQWLVRVRQPMRPPMPWFNLRDMADEDLIAIYRYLRAMGPAGEPAPAALAPGLAASTPYFDFTPKNLPPHALK